jgi:hypothetical protein
MVAGAGRPHRPVVYNEIGADVVLCAIGADVVLCDLATRPAPK